MEATNLIQQFGQLAGIDLKLGAQGTLALAFEAGPTLHLEHDPVASVLHVYAVLGQEPADSHQRAILHRRLLAANAFCHETGGATLGLDEKTGDIVLAQRLVLDHAADAIALRALIESLVPQARHWQQQLAESPAAALEPVDAPRLMPDFGMRA